MEMIKRRLGPLVLFHLLLPPAAWAFWAWGPGDWHAKWVAKNAFLVATFSETGLAAAWLGLVGAASPRRLAGAAWVWAQCWCLLVASQDDEWPLNLAEYLLVPAAITFAMAAAMRWSLNQSQRSLALGLAASDWQFSVGQMLAFTGIIAVVIVLAQKFVEGDLIVNNLALVSEASQLAMVTMVWAMLRRRGRSVCGAAALVLACAVGMIAQSYQSRHYFWEIVRVRLAASPWDCWEDFFSVPTFTVLLALGAAASVVYAARCGYSLLPGHNS